MAIICMVMYYILMTQLGKYFTLIHEKFQRVCRKM
jgi:hypothetical protein